MLQSYYLCFGVYFCFVGVFYKLCTRTQGNIQKSTPNQIIVMFLWRSVTWLSCWGIWFVAEKIYCPLNSGYQHFTYENTSAQEDFDDSPR